MNSPTKAFSTIQLPSNLLTVGRFGTVHGVKGLVKVISATQTPTDIFNYASWYLKLTSRSQLPANFQPILANNQQKYLPVQVLSWQILKQELFVIIAGFENREDARLLNNHEIVIDRSQLPELEEDFYWVDLIGSTVVTPEGIIFGKVSTIMETGSNDVLVVKASEDAIDKKERLIPVIMDQVIVAFDKQQKLLIVNWDVDF